MSSMPGELLPGTGLPPPHAHSPSQDPSQIAGTHMERKNIFIRLQSLIHNQDGQDLIEYALVVALIAFAATAGMNSLATSINTAFTNMANTLTTYTG